MKTRSEENHDVRLLSASIFDFLVGDFIKGQRDDSLPDPKGPPDGLVRVVLSDFRSVVLNAERVQRGRKSDLDIFKK